MVIYPTKCYNIIVNLFFHELSAFYASYINSQTFRKIQKSKPQYMCHFNVILHMKVLIIYIRLCPCENGKIFTHDKSLK